MFIYFLHPMLIQSILNLGLEYIRISSLVKFSLTIIDLIYGMTMSHCFSLFCSLEKKNLPWNGPIVRCAHDYSWNRWTSSDHYNYRRSIQFCHHNFGRSILSPDCQLQLDKGLNTAQPLTLRSATSPSNYTLYVAEDATRSLHKN